MLLQPGSVTPSHGGKLLLAEIYVNQYQESLTICIGNVLALASFSGGGGLVVNYN